MIFIFLPFVYLFGSRVLLDFGVKCESSVISTFCGVTIADRKGKYWAKPLTNEIRKKKKTNDKKSKQQYEI